MITVPARTRPLGPKRAPFYRRAAKRETCGIARLHCRARAQASSMKRTHFFGGIRATKEVSACGRSSMAEHGCGPVPFPRPEVRFLAPALFRPFSYPFPAGTRRSENRLSVARSGVFLYDEYVPSEGVSVLPNGICRARNQDAPLIPEASFFVASEKLSTPHICGLAHICKAAYTCSYQQKNGGNMSNQIQGHKHEWQLGLIESPKVTRFLNGNTATTVAKAWFACECGSFKINELVTEL